MYRVTQYSLHRIRSAKAVSAKVRLYTDKGSIKGGNHYERILRNKYTDVYTAIQRANIQMYTCVQLYK